MVSLYQPQGQIPFRSILLYSLRGCFLQVYLPPEDLKSVALSNSAADVTVGPGFKPESLGLFSAFSTGDMNVLNITVGQLVVGSSG